MYLYHSWLADLAGTVIETHPQQRRRLAERPRSDNDTDLVTRAEPTSDQTQVGVMSAEAVHP